MPNKHPSNKKGKNLGGETIKEKIWKLTIASMALARISHNEHQIILF
jgi:hypothetical protein